MYETTMYENYRYNSFQLPSACDTVNNCSGGLNIKVNY